VCGGGKKRMEWLELFDVVVNSGGGKRSSERDT
jgi:hypothetical protein